MIKHDPTMFSSSPLNVYSSGLCFAVLLTVTTFTAASEEDFATPDEVSPYEEVSESAEARPSDGLESLEFRSVVSLPDGYLFSLREPQSGRNFWIEIGQVRRGIEAVHFDSDRDQLTVRRGDHERVLTLSSARVRAQPPMDESLLPVENRLREALQKRMDGWETLSEKWEAAAEESPELRDIAQHYEDNMNEIVEVRNALQRAEKDSKEYERLRELLAHLRLEYNRLNHATAAVLEKHPDFDKADIALLRGENVNYAFGNVPGSGEVNEHHFMVTDLVQVPPDPGAQKPRHYDPFNDPSRSPLAVQPFWKAESRRSESWRHLQSSQERSSPK